MKKYIQDSPDSTWGIYKRNLLPVTGLREEQFIRVRTDLDCEQAAADYQGQSSTNTC